MKKALTFFSLIAAVAITVMAGGALYGEEEPLTVLGDRVDATEERERQPGFVDIIEVSAPGTRVDTIAGVLSRRAGIQVKNYGGAGSRSYLSIRGVNSNQVMIYLNGVPLNDARFGEVDLGTIPLDNVERIEIYRGVTPAEFDTPGIGGAVNIVTRKKISFRRTAVSVSYGSFNTSSVSVSHVQNFKKTGYSLFFNRNGSRGDFTYRDDNGTPVVNTADDFITSRKNNEHASYAGTGTFDYVWGKFTLSLANDFFYKDQGLPGLSGNETEHVSLTTLRNTTSLKLRANRAFLKKLDSSLNFYYSLRIDDYHDGEGELGLGAERQKGDFGSLGAGLSNSYLVETFSQEVKLHLFFNRETWQRKEKNVSWETYPSMNRLRFAAAAEDSFYFFKERFHLALQGRYECYRDSFYDELAYATGGSAPRSSRVDHLYGGSLGARLNLCGESLYLKGNMGLISRKPNFTELFGDRGYVMGNPDLDSERAFNRDIGIGWSYKKKKGKQKKQTSSFLKYLDFIKCECSFFYNTIDEMIIFIYNSQFTMKADNISRARLYGVESTISAGIFGHLDLGGNYTYQRALDTGDIPSYRGKTLPHRPMHQVSLKAKVHNRYAALTYEMDYTGYIFRDRINSEFYYIEGRVTHCLICQAFPLRGLVLTFEIKNISNSQVRDVIGSPLPGRSYYGTASYSF